MIRIFILILTFALCVDGSCFFGAPLLDEETFEFYCELPGGDRMSMYETRDIDFCMRCDCSPYGLECCGFGINAGVFKPPPGMKIVLDPPCDFHFEVDETPV